MRPSVQPAQTLHKRNHRNNKQQSKPHFDNDNGIETTGTGTSMDSTYNFNGRVFPSTVSSSVETLNPFSSTIPIHDDGSSNDDPSPFHGNHESCLESNNNPQQSLSQSKWLSQSKS